MVMCIWEVEKSKRHCEFCSFRGGCEVYPVIIGPDNDGEVYIRCMSRLVGDNIVDRCREKRFVWGRNIVAYQMRMDGFSTVHIGKCLGINHSTVSYATNQVTHMLNMPGMYRDEFKLFENFQEMLSLQKKQ